jgi:hypothetical protein
VLTDGDGGTSANYDTTVTVTAVNDAPLNTVPGAQSTNEETALVFSLWQRQSNLYSRFRCQRQYV